ncbi:MAG: hypothetical protein JXB05_29140 [Myxococcaceae bacterium]|nr:hypothetical protein [Myxococcaceae bacterium]
MHLRTCSAPLLLLLLSACATMDPSPGEVEAPSPGELEAPSPRFANLQRAAQYPWTDDGHCVVREASDEWPILAERCFHALDRDRVRLRDVTGRCAVASAPAAAAAVPMGVALCVFASPVVVTGAVIVIGTVVVAVAIKEGLDAYERNAARERAKPKTQTRPSSEQEPVANGEPTPKGLGRGEIEKEIEQLHKERNAAIACGYDFVVGVSTEAHKQALLDRDPELNIVVTGCPR